MSLEDLRRKRIEENKKLLNDVAGIFAELDVTYQQAEDIASTLSDYFDSASEEDEWVDKASNATTGGECSC